MKVGTSAVTQQQAAKTNKRPQLALDAAFKQTGSGIQIYVERPGHGDKAKDGSHVKVHYEGWLAEDYKMFDSSRAKRRPFEFDLGKGSVISGWDEALKGVREGTKLKNQDSGRRNRKSRKDGTEESAVVSFPWGFG